MAELIQLVPFDETSGTTAQDFSGNGNSLTIQEGEWVKGKLNNCIYLSEENSKAELLGEVLIDFNFDFTISFWIKCEGTISSSWIILMFEDDNFIYVNINSNLSKWTYLCLIQENDSLIFYKNGEKKVIENYDLSWGKPIYFNILNDNEVFTITYLDELSIYRGVNIDSIKPKQDSMTIEYKINYVDFKDYSVSVRKGDGFFDALKMKEPFKVDWADEHGEVLDLTEVRYEPRTITLDCFIHGTTKDVFDEKVKGFLDKFYGSGTKRLHINTGSIDYVYEVYLRDGSNVKKKWRDSDMIGEFTLTLVEPQPIKRIIHFIRADGNTTASITLTCPRPLTIYWGDGTITDNVMGTSVTKTHTYSANGSKFIILAGVIEKVSSLTTNGTLMNGANSYY